MQHINFENIMDINIVKWKIFLRQSVNKFCKVYSILALQSHLMLTRYIRTIEVLHVDTKNSASSEFSSYAKYILLYCTRKITKSLIEG